MLALYHVPPLLLLLAALAVALLLACGGQLYVHQRLPSADFMQQNEVGGHVIAVVGTLYAVLLGFLTVVVWEHFTQAGQQVTEESAAAADAWHTAVGLPYPIRSRVRHDMLQYASIMIDSEWPAMQSGGYSPQADIAVMDAMAVTGTFVPGNASQASSQMITQQQLATLHDERQRRFSNSDTPVSWFEWLILLVGAVCVVGFCWLFGVRNRGLHLLMTSTVTIVIVAILVLLFELQYPFRTAIGVSADTWKGFVGHVHLMENASGNLKGMRM